jgi:hypothetical protein
MTRGIASKHLHRHLPPQRLLLGQIDIPHRAASQPAQEPIPSEASPGEIVLMGSGRLRL